MPNWIVRIIIVVLAVPAVIIVAGAHAIDGVKAAFNVIRSAWKNPENTRFGNKKGR